MDIRGRIITAAIATGVVIGAAGGSFAIANAAQNDAAPTLHVTDAPVTSTPTPSTVAHTYKVSDASTATPTPTPSTESTTPAAADTTEPASAPATSSSSSSTTPTEQPADPGEPSQPSTQPSAPSEPVQSDPPTVTLPVAHPRDASGNDLNAGAPDTITIPAPTDQTPPPLPNPSAGPTVNFGG